MVCQLFATGFSQLMYGCLWVLEQSLEVLYRRVAPNAILNAAGRADQVRCHPGTRKTVIGRIEKWRMEAIDSLAPPIFWLSGPAGAGKSAIVQTVAEGWKAKTIPQANFFFFRTDPSRNSLAPLMATLVHQVILIYPQLRDSVEVVLSRNPVILGSSIEEQLMELIINPLRNLHRSSSSYHPPVLLIDGLDECDSDTKDNQRKILLAFNKILVQNPGYVYLLVASRDESQIQATFNRIDASLFRLYLDNQYSPENDIRLFVEDELDQIKATHPLGHKLGENWPSVRDVDDIVTKSSGQFIYAAVVMRFIAHSSDSPILSLQRVQDAAARTKSNSPFSQLDAVYDYILSQVEDQEALQDILNTQLLVRRSFSTTDPVYDPVIPLMPLLNLYKPKYTEAIISSCLANLTPIAQYTHNNRLLFHHASFPDYLLDQSRSGDRFVDHQTFRVKLVPAMWKCIDASGKTSRWISVVIVAFL